MREAATPRPMLLRSPAALSPASHGSILFARPAALHRAACIAPQAAPAGCGTGGASRSPGTRSTRPSRLSPRSGHHPARENATASRSFPGIAAPRPRRPCAQSRKTRSWLFRRWFLQILFECRVVPVHLSVLVQRLAAMLHPRMRFEFLVFFAHPNAQARGDSLPAQQIPESEGFFEAGIVKERIAQRGDYHAACGPHFFLFAGWDLRFLCRRGNALLERCKGLAIAPQVQRPSQPGQENRGAPEHLPRRKVQRFISLKCFPHPPAALGASRSPPACSKGKVSP